MIRLIDSAILGKFLELVRAVAIVVRFGRKRDDNSEREFVEENGYVGDGITAGTILEYDDWQWVLVSELALDRYDPKIGFIPLDELDDDIIHSLNWPMDAASATPLLNISEMASTNIGPTLTTCSPTVCGVFSVRFIPSSANQTIVRARIATRRRANDPGTHSAGAGGLSLLR